MDDERCRQFFLEPTETAHRKYEALRAFFVEGRQLQEIAQQFGYQESSLRSIVYRFRAQMQNNGILAAKAILLANSMINAIND
jgi:hypothetical protein